MKILEWIKSNKITSVIILVIAYILYTNYSYVFYNWKMQMSGSDYADYGYGYGGDAYGGVYMDEARPTNKMATGMMPIAGGGAPQLDVQDRMTVTTSWMSMLVKDVAGAIAQIKDKVGMVGGYVVNQNMETPEGLSTGSITIRVPSDRLDETTSFLKNLAVRVVSENVDGYDVTDEYVDIEERLALLEKTKVKYEAILDSAVEVEDILTVTERILYVQSQIDSYVGRKDYLEKIASSSLITIYLSTDEYELPFAPDQPWRPSVVLKYATRSMIGTLRDFGSFIIWVAVYAVVWVPAIIVVLFVKKKMKMRVNKPQLK